MLSLSLSLSVSLSVSHSLPYPLSMYCPLLTVQAHSTHSYLFFLLISLFPTLALSRSLLFPILVSHLISLILTCSTHVLALFLTFSHFWTLVNFWLEIWLRFYLWGIVFFVATHLGWKFVFKEELCFQPNTYFLFSSDYVEYNWIQANNASRVKRNCAI